jgi:Coenzyme PQQ synthesis protein D (PqqD)
MKKTIENPAALARNDELVVQDLPDEVLIYDLKSHKAHCLNTTAAFIWKHCDGQTTADEIAKMMQQEWQTPVTEDAVWFALNKLSKAELLQQRIVLPEARAGMSRRSAMRRLGLGALLIPVVMTIVSPTAMAGSSIPPACQACIKKITGAADCVTPTADCTKVPGACFDNAGCGNGQFLLCQPCGACLGGHGGLTTVSWQAATNGC